MILRSLIIFTFLFPILVNAQSLTAEKVTTGFGTANSGEYSYRATVKTRSYLPGLGDIRIKFAITDYEITSFTYKGINASDIDGVNFPIRINNIQSDFKFWIRFDGIKYRSYFIEGEEPSVSSSFIDFYDLTPNEVTEFINIFGIAKKSDFSNVYSINLQAELLNSYFYELSKVANLIDQKIAQGKLTEKKAELEAEEKKDDAFEKWKEQKEQEAKETLKRIEIEAEKEKKQKETEEKKRVYKDSFKSRSQKKHERDVKDWSNVFSSLSDINIPDADVETVSLGLSYANSNFNDLEIFMNVMNAWGNFYIGANFKGVMHNYDTWKPYYDTEDKNELFSSNILKEGDLLFNDYREKDNWSTGNKTLIHRIYRKERERSYGFGLDLETGLRFQLSNSSAIRLGVTVDLSTGSNDLLNYGYGFSAQYELGRIVFGIGYNTRFYKYELFNDEYTLTELKGIFQPDDLQINNDWASRENSIYAGNEFTYYSTTHNKVESTENFNVFKQKFFKFSLTYKLH